MNYFLSCRYDSPTILCCPLYGFCHRPHRKLRSRACWRARVKGSNQCCYKPMHGPGAQTYIQSSYPRSEYILDLEIVIRECDEVAVYAADYLIDTHYLLSLHPRNASEIHQKKNTGNRKNCMPTVLVCNRQY